MQGSNSKFAASESSYRADIDGLRAVAVLGVILYHFFGQSFLRGGFTGVDIFFVISGFVITRKLRREIANNDFSVIKFYEGRLRRLIPALTLMISVTMAAGWLFLTPGDYENLARSAAFSSVGLGNIFFYWNTGYFDQLADLQPLLHTWSLGVEEQFYLLWPIIIFALLRFIQRPRVAVSMIASATLVSFAYAVYLVPNDAKSAFYLPIPRAWELALGAMIAFAPKISSPTKSQLTSFVGMLLVAWSMLRISSSHSFPGLNALYACTGASLIIWPKSPTLVASALAMRPAVLVGLMSYSLYLWHWPIIVFFTHYNFGVGPTPLQAALLALVAAGLAAMSWRFVETPLRMRRSCGETYIMAAGCLAILLAGSATILQTEGAIQRLPQDLRNVATFTNFKISGNPNYVCEVNSQFNSLEDYDDRCLQAPPGTPNVLLIGDSHALHFLKALRQIFPQVHFSQATGTYCRPVFHGEGDPGCVSLMDHVYSMISDGRKFDAVIISARWQNGGVEKIQSTLELIKEHVPSIFVFGQTVEYDAGLPGILMAEHLLRSNFGKTISHPHRFNALNAKIRDIATNHGAEFFDPTVALCGTSACETMVGNAPISFDYGHFTSQGAAFVLKKFVDAGLKMPTSEPLGVSVNHALDRVLVIHQH